MKKPPTWMSDDLVFLDERCPLPLDAPFTSDQAQALGVSRWYQRILLDRGLIRPVLRGTFVAAQVVDSVDVRAASLRLVVPATGVVTDETAAWLHGVDVLPPSALYTPPPLRVFSTGGSRLRRPEVASGTRQLSKEDITEIQRVRVTSPLRTALDLGRGLRRFAALAALDGFVRIGVPWTPSVCRSNAFAASAASCSYAGWFRWPMVSPSRLGVLAATALVRRRPAAT